MLEENLGDLSPCINVDIDSSPLDPAWDDICCDDFDSYSHLLCDIDELLGGETISDSVIDSLIACA